MGGGVPSGCGWAKRILNPERGQGTPRLCFAPCSCPEVGKALTKLKIHWQLGALENISTSPRAKVDCDPPPHPQIHSGFGLGGEHAPLRFSLSTSGSPHPDKLQCHYGGSCCLRPRGYLGFACTPLLHCAESWGEGEQGPGIPGDCLEEKPHRAASGLLPIPPRCLPGGTMSTEPGRPLAFHYRA